MIQPRPFPQNDTLPNIVEDYIEVKMNRETFSEQYFRDRLKKLRRSEENINALLIKMYEEHEKEHFQISSQVNPKKLIILGIIILVASISFTVWSFLQRGRSGGSYVIMIGSAVSAFISILKGCDQINMKRHRKEIRKLKWEIL